MTAVLRLPVGVLVERRKSASPWIDFVWRPVAVLGGLSGLPEAAPWTALSGGEEATTFYAGAAEIELHPSEVDNYRRNLESAAPSIWVALHANAGEPPYDIVVVTADPTEGEGLTEPAAALVEAVPIPESLRQAIASFVAAHPREHRFEKRQRDRADPEALGRRTPRLGEAS